MDAFILKFQYILLKKCANTELMHIIYGLFPQNTCSGVPQ